jgi:hypothetical protein
VALMESCATLGEALQQASQRSYAHSAASRGPTSSSAASRAGWASPSSPPSPPSAASGSPSRPRASAGARGRRRARKRSRLSETNKSEHPPLWQSPRGQFGLRGRRPIAPARWRRSAHEGYASRTAGEP